ncbi:hypothetical protein QAD02_018774 [Eretmocerus hayati]|uniref:Uncharacterized protein n=1 Tax=Eretmocerus hayati TaxID=131215 RepID=A0ACC2PHP1_9HYME|nr:hypothetical protein QAD02_018774 [Eretmocerus hayati]
MASSMGRLTLLLVVICAFLAIANCGSKEQVVVTAGTRVPGDELLKTDFIHELPQKGEIQKKARTFLVAQVEENGKRRNRNITYVEAIDQSINGKGASAKIVKNGPGYPNVTVQFVSQKSEGIHYKINMYGL